MEEITWRLRKDKREDGYIISTIKPLSLAWYGEYETAIIKGNGEEIRTAAAYNTKEEALKGHEKFLNMTTEEIENINYLD